MGIAMSLTKEQRENFYKGLRCSPPTDQPLCPQEFMEQYELQQAFKQAYKEACSSGTVIKEDEEER